MYCQNCKKNEATIHLTEITNGSRTEAHLCEHCAHEEGIAVKSHIPINELLSNLLATQPSDKELFSSTEKELSCPHCSFTLDRFAREAVLGCPYDYQVFEKSLLPLIEKAHDGQVFHRGKVPAKTSEDTKKQMKLLSLNKQLEAAVKSENYELAAKLRDKIDQAES